LSATTSIFSNQGWRGTVRRSPAIGPCRQPDWLPQIGAAPNVVAVAFRAANHVNGNVGIQTDFGCLRRKTRRDGGHCRLPEAGFAAQIFVRSALGDRPITPHAKISVHSLQVASSAISAALAQRLDFFREILRARATRRALCDIAFVKPVEISSSRSSAALMNCFSEFSREAAVLVVDRIDARAVHRQQLASEQIEPPAQQHELTKHRSDGSLRKPRRSVRKVDENQIPLSSVPY
jgi:hypothetical protein